MKLNGLLEVIDYSFDFADNEIDVIFYEELDNILSKYLKQIKVCRISQNYIICDFVDFIQHHKTLITKYIYNNYQDAWASWLYNGLFEKDEQKRYFAYNDEAYAYFIEHDLAIILTNDEI